MIHAFKLDQNAVEATQNSWRSKRWRCTWPQYIDPRWLKKFPLGCKNFDNQARSNRPKTVDFETVPWAIKANPTSYTWRVSVELGISQSSVVRHLHNLGKSIWSCDSCYQNIAKLLTPPRVLGSCQSTTENNIFNLCFVQLTGVIFQSVNGHPSLNWIGSPLLKLQWYGRNRCFQVIFLLFSKLFFSRYQNIAQFLTHQSISATKSGTEEE